MKLNNEVQGGQEESEFRINIKILKKALKNAKWKAPCYDRILDFWFK